MNDEELLRYSRHLLLPELDVAGQQRLLDASVLIVGLGGLGSPAALYLAASGVGRLLLADADRVEVSNLQRQVLHATASVGRPKTDSARETLQRLNPLVVCEAFDARVDAALLDGLLPRVALVLDCSDNYATRYAINDACLRHRVPLVSAAAIRWEAQLAVFDARDAASPCYECLYPDRAAAEDLACARNGVAAPVVGLAGVMQALQALKLLSGAGSAQTGSLMLFDGLAAEWHTLRVPRRADCAACGAGG